MWYSNFGNNYESSPVISESDLIDFFIGVRSVFPLMSRQNSKSANNDLQFDFLFISQKFEIIRVYLSMFSFLLFEKYSKTISTFLNQNSLMTHNKVLFKKFFDTFGNSSRNIMRSNRSGSKICSKNFHLKIVINKR